MNLAVNELLKHKTTDRNEIERVLWIDEENITAVTIDALSSNPLPQIKNVLLILDQIESGLIEKISEDPYFRLIDEDKLDNKHKVIRDTAWDIISDAVSCEPNIYYREERGALIQKIMEKHSVTKSLVYKYLRKYWQRGKNKNTLLPDYHKSGGKGKAKTLGQKKLGRPRTRTDIQGINVDAETKRIFKVALNKFYYTAKKNPLTTAYELMLKEFYSEGSRFEDGIEKPILKDADVWPSFSQFKYWYYKELNLEKTISTRKGKKNYELKHRKILGKSDAEVMGPGAKYQIDATVADVYLRSRYNKDWIIGRPVIYVVIDVYSRMVVGIYVGLEGPSWLGAMMALANTASDKVQFCSEYGINISEQDWPCRYLPDAILADRGEMESKKVNTLINALHIRIENTPPYRADWKGIVEQCFRTLNTKTKPFLPGFIDTDFRQRGGKDYRLDAKLTLPEFTEVIIRCVLYHNNIHWMENFNRDEIMIAGDVNPIPRELWNWGIANRSGFLRVINEDIVKLNLMPTEIATVTEAGIKLKNLRYNCDIAMKEHWFEKARNRGSWKGEISYDPRNMDSIYFRTDNGRNFEKCYLINAERYGNKTLDEIIYLDESEKRKKQTKSESTLQGKVNLFAEIEDIVSRAEKRDVQQPISDISDTQKVKGIRNNRGYEKDRNRKSEHFDLGAKTSKVNPTNKNIADIISMAGQRIEDDDLGEMDYLLKKQKERLEKKDE